MPCESIDEAMEWVKNRCGDNKKDAIKSGFDGIPNGLGRQFRLVEVTFKVLPQVYRRKWKQMGRV